MAAVAWMCVRVRKAGVEVAVGGANAVEATSCEGATETLCIHSRRQRTRCPATPTPFRHAAITPRHTHEHRHPCTWSCIVAC